MADSKFAAPPKNLSEDAYATFMLAGDLWEQLEVAKPTVGLFAPMLDILQTALVQCAAGVVQLDTMRKR